MGQLPSFRVSALRVSPLRRTTRVSRARDVAFRGFWVCDISKKGAALFYFFPFLTTIHRGDLNRTILMYNQT